MINLRNSNFNENVYQSEIERFNNSNFDRENNNLNNENSEDLEKNSKQEQKKLSSNRLILNDEDNLNYKENNFQN